MAIQGEAAALTAAFLWAVSTLLFGRLGKHLTPTLLNAAKGLLAIAMIALTLLFRQANLSGLTAVSVGVLLASGAIGIGLGDTAYFSALNYLGARRVLLMETLAPPLAAVLALIFLQEQLSALAWVGIGLTLLGVSWVISERVPVADQTPPLTLPGILYGGLAALGQATGAVLSRFALADSLVDPLGSSLLRLLGGLVILLGLLRWRGPIADQVRPLRSGRVLGGVAIAAFFGTYLAIWLQQTALKYAPTGIAQALTSTSPLFILPIAALLGDRITLRAVGGVLVALMGIWLLVGNG